MNKLSEEEEERESSIPVSISRRTVFAFIRWVTFVNPAKKRRRKNERIISLYIYHGKIRVGFLPGLKPERLKAQLGGRKLLMSI